MLTHEQKQPRQQIISALLMTHCIIDGRGEDAKQAGHPASNSRQHSLTLHQGSVLKLSRSIWTHSKELIFDGGQDKASTLRRIK